MWLEAVKMSQWYTNKVKVKIQQPGMWECKDAVDKFWSIKIVRDFGVSRLATAFKNNTVKHIDKYSKIFESKLLDFSLHI